MLVMDILKKKELKNIDVDYALREIERFFVKNPDIRKKYSALPYKQFVRSKEYEKMLKAVRSNLRAVYGVFQKQIEKRDRYLTALKGLDDKEGHVKLLRTHLSSLERLDYYPLLYKKIFEITGFPSSILDVACGLNPLSVPFMKCNPNYTAVELNEKDCEFLEKYFSHVGISGKAIAVNLLHDASKLKEFKADVCFLFKTLDSLEVVKHNISIDILKNINTKFIVVSFPTVTVGGKPMKSKRRLWFEKMVKSFEIVEIPNEIFYVVKQ